MSAVWIWIWAVAKIIFQIGWVLFWPIGLGFIGSGLIQGFAPQEKIVNFFQKNSLKTVSIATIAGALSSSCSFVASSIANTWRKKGATWLNSTTFMVASTNLVIELGLVILILLGFKFLLAEIMGGLIMISLLALTNRIFWKKTPKYLTILNSEPDAKSHGIDLKNFHSKIVTSARFSIGDLKMIRRELFLGLIIAGLISAHIPDSFWRNVFWTGHGFWTILENVILAPLVAVISSVCSVGNIPIALSLWTHGVTFSGTLAFIYSDLIAFPLIAIYRKFYGGKIAFKLVTWLWLTISAASAITEFIWSAFNWIPKPDSLTALPALRNSDHPGMSMSGSMNMPFHFSAFTSTMNIVAAFALLITWFLAKSKVETGQAIDPICGMAVAINPDAISREISGKIYYFCAESCATEFIKVKSQG